MGPMSIHVNLPGPFSARLRGLSFRQQIAQDKQTVRETREALRGLRAAFTRGGESKKSRKLRRETLRENERRAKRYRRDGTIT
ncbi:hypothetical protein SEA_JACKIEB_41 [Streptomyces phage JackieB]|nr:hypothetical protein SEA_JACKIEB_41 [Streptomyces phage JackieB]